MADRPWITVLVALLAGTMMMGCDGKSPTSPVIQGPPAPPPTPGAVTGEITIESITPGPGSTLVVEDCPDGYADWVCNKEMQITFSVLVDRDVQNANLGISFGDCAFAFTEELVTLRAGSRTAMTTSGVTMNFENEHDANPVLRCPLPATTSDIVAELRENQPFQVLLSRVFPVSYTFSRP